MRSQLALLRPFLVLVAVSGGAGCGLFPDLGNLSSGGTTCNGDACMDGSVQPTDAFIRPEDASVRDAFADAPAVTFCKTSPEYTLCEDFDDVPLPGAFAGNEVGPGGKLWLEKYGPASGASFLISTINPGSPPEATAYLYRAFPVPASALILSFSIRIDALTQGKGADFARIVLAPDTPTVHVLTIGYRGSLELGEQFGPGLGTYIGHTASSSPKVGEWARLVVTLSPSNHVIQATLDGNVVLNEPIDTTWEPANHRVQLGVSYAQGAATGWRFSYDDFTYVAK